VLTFVGGGSTSQTLTVHTDTDTVVEGTENYSVQITNPTIGSIGTGSAATDIIDDDAAKLQWSVTGTSQLTEGQDGVYTVSYTGATLGAGQTATTNIIDNDKSISGEVCVSEDANPNQYDHSLAQTPLQPALINFADVVTQGASDDLTGLTITGLPTGATLEINGHSYSGASITLTGADADAWEAGSSIKVTPSQDASDDFTLGFKATFQDGTVTQEVDGNVAVTVNAVADDPTGVGFDVSPNGIAYTVSGDKATGVSQLFRVDLDTGALTAVGPVSIPGSNSPDVEGLAFNSATGLLYGFTTGPGASSKLLVSIDPATGATTVIGSPNGLGTEIGTEFVGSTLYVVASSGNHSDMYTVNLTTGALTSVGSTQSNVQNEGLAYDCEAG
jgi:hypothetical protein